MTARSRYRRLLSPITLGPVTLRNRAVVSGHSMNHGEVGHPGISPRSHAYLVARAQGGAAMVGIESAPVHITSRQPASQVELFLDECLPTLTGLAHAVHEAGAKLSVILWHGGHNITHRNGLHALGPSPLPGPRTREIARAMTAADIREIVAAYASAARRAVQAGVDVLEVQTATNYLLGAFLSPTLNRRTDSYGGSLENRARIVCEILEAVRAEAGSRAAVGVRTSIAHFIPGDPRDYDADDSLAAMQHLSRRGLLDYVSLMTGSHWSFAEALPVMTKPRPHIADQAAVFRRNLDIPITVAGRIRLPAEAEAILAQGQADIVAMARTWIAEPDWIRKIETDQEDRIRPCMTCNQACLGFMARGLPGTCVINPAAGRELELPPPQAATRPKRIAVIGGGPAGLEFARVAAERGHTVTLYESTAQLGGQMRWAAEAPHRAEMLPALAWWEQELQRLQVRVVRNRTIRAGERLDADEVVWATGSVGAQTAVWRLRPYLAMAPLPGTEALPHGRDIFAGTAMARGKVLILDEESGWAAVSLAERLAAQADVSAVTVVTSDANLGLAELAITYEDADVLQRVKRAGIAVQTGRTVDRVDGGMVVLTGGERLGPFDSIVLSTGALPRDVPEDARAIGDCVAPRTIWAATTDAARLARTI